MNAVISTISYHLARHHNTVQLDTKTFLPVSKQPLKEHGETPPPSLNPFTLDFYLTAGGNLVISTGLDYAHKLRTIRQSEDVSAVYLAVAGLSGELLEEPSSGGDADMLDWKELVKEKLALRGIHLAEIDCELRWALVRACPTSVDDSGDATALSSVVFYWPAVLCFHNDGVNLHGHSRNLITEIEEIDGTDPASWFSPPGQGGFRDPIHFAEDWFRGKGDRDRVIAERRRKQREIEAAQRQAEGAALSVPSPFYTRGDLQSVGGVYPTPPDGLPQASSTQIPQDIPAVAGANLSARPSVDYQTGDGMDLDMGLFNEGVKMRGPSIISRGSMQLDTSMHMGDDLFGEMDEDDDFVGNDITDADFSFFDEPDLDDEGMLGPSSSAAIPPDEDVDPLAITDGKEIKIELSTEEPVVMPLEDSKHALVLDDIKNDTHSNDPPVEETTPVQVIPESPPSIKSPLSPTSVRRKLFEFAIDEKRQASQNRRHSTFDPVSFSSGLGKTDAKYTMDGAFSFVPPDPTNALKRPPDNVFSISLPPRKKRARIGPPVFPGGQLVIAKDNGWDSDQSSVISDASDEDSITEFGGMSLATSPVKVYQSKRLWELQDGETTSRATSPGFYIATDDGFNSGMAGSLKVCSPNFFRNSTY
jgi:mediator of RNA polymerase II transcription subunit 13